MFSQILETEKAYIFTSFFILFSVFAIFWRKPCCRTRLFCNIMRIMLHQLICLHYHLKQINKIWTEEKRNEKKKTFIPYFVLFVSLCDFLRINALDAAKHICRGYWRYRCHVRGEYESLPAVRGWKEIRIWLPPRSIWIMCEDIWTHILRWQMI